MRYSEILNEAYNEIVIPDGKLEEIINNFNPHALKQLQAGNIILRGSGGKYDCMHVTPLENRVSPYASNNFYNLLLSNLDEWKEYPARNKSHICTNKKAKANTYGSRLHLVIPMPNAKIGICSRDDIWQSFLYLKQIYGFKNMSDWNDTLRDVLSSFNITTPNIDKDYSLLINKIRKLDEKIPFMNTNSKLINDEKEFVKKGTLEKTIIDMLNPRLNQFQLVDYPSYNISIHSDSQEVWFTGDALYFYIENQDVTDEFEKLGIKL